MKRVQVIRDGKVVTDNIMGDMPEISSRNCTITDKKDDLVIHDDSGKRPKIIICTDRIEKVSAEATKASAEAARASANAARVAANSVRIERDAYRSAIEGQIGRAHVELQSLMRISYAVFCLKKKKKQHEKQDKA